MGDSGQSGRNPDGAARLFFFSFFPEDLDFWVGAAEGGGRGDG